MHVGIAYLRWRGKHSRRMRTRNFAYLARGPWYGLADASFSMILDNSVYSRLSSQQGVVLYVFNPQEKYIFSILPMQFHFRGVCDKSVIKHSYCVSLRLESMYSFSSYMSNQSMFVIAKQPIHLGVHHIVSVNQKEIWNINVAIMRLDHLLMYFSFHLITLSYLILHKTKRLR